MIFTGNVRVQVDGVVTGALAQYTPYWLTAQPLGTGVTDGLANLAYVNRRTIASAGSPDTFDLAGGGLIGVDGNPISYAEVTTIVVANFDENQQLTVGQATNGFQSSWMVGTSPGIKLPKAYKPTNQPVRPTFFVLHCSRDPAFPVAAGTADIFQVATDGGTNIQYDVMLFGRDA